jgi:hypothetical protein
MPLYNPLVMSKLYWLDEVAAADPLQVGSAGLFLWIDAGLCVRFLAPPLRMRRVRELTAPAAVAGGGSGGAGRFLAYAMDHGYDGGTDVHGFPRAGHTRFGAAAAAARHLLRGNILGGTRGAVAAALAAFDAALRDTLAAGLMGPEESGLTLACGRAAAAGGGADADDGGGGGLCAVESVSQNHLGTEAPCGMFLALSAAGPAVALAHPPPGAPVAAEGFVCAARVSRFRPGPDGAVCCTWDGGGRACAPPPPAPPPAGGLYYIVVDGSGMPGRPAGLPPGPLGLRAELLGRDGLPIASSGRPAEVWAEPAQPGSMDLDGPVPDARGDLSALLAGRRLAGSAVAVALGGGEAAAARCAGLAAEVAARGEYAGDVRVGAWDPAAVEPRCGGGGGGGGAGEDGCEAGGRAAGLDMVYLCAGPGVSEAAVAAGMEWGLARLAPEGGRPASLSYTLSFLSQSL